jgi:hypothetical protein
MREIYKSSECVYVVLSSPSYRMNAAMTGLEEMSRIWLEYELCDQESPTPSFGGLKMFDAEGNELVDPAEHHEVSLREHMCHTFFPSKLHIFPRFRTRLNCLFNFSEISLHLHGGLEPG